MSRQLHALLLTGRPGVGKTTLVRRVAERLPKTIHPAGFYTEEIRVRGERRGFRAVTFDGAERVMAHVDVGGRDRVGKYGVDVAAIDELAQTTLRLHDDRALYVVDEIGRMECLSRRFVDAMRALLDAQRVVLATIGLRPSTSSVEGRVGGFIAEAKAREDVELWEVTRANRDALVERATAWVGERIRQA